jgi:hypothetical protein
LSDPFGLQQVTALMRGEYLQSGTNREADERYERIPKADMVDV